MELHLFDELLQAVLHVRLPDVPFLEQDDFNRVLAALRNGDLLFLLDHVGDVPGRFQVLDGGRTGLEHRHAGERPSERGHATFKVDGLEGVQSQLPEDSDVVLVAKEQTIRTPEPNSIFTEGCVRTSTTASRPSVGMGRARV